jgi:predicted transcriptional regulator
MRKEYTIKLEQEAIEQLDEIAKQNLTKPRTWAREKLEAAIKREYNKMKKGK